MRDIIFKVGRMKFGLIILSILLITASCFRSNKLKSDETILGGKILLEEKEKEKQKEELKLQNKNNETSFGIKFSEDTKARLSGEPKTLNILKSRENKSDISLSAICSDLDYIHLSIPGDTSFMGGANKVVFTPNFIYVSASKGLACFDHGGRFLKLICESTTDHITMSDDGKMAYVSSESMKVFYGNTGDINAIGDRLVYLYKDYPNEINQLMMFDPVRDRNVVPGISDEIDNRKGNPVGSILRSFSMDYRGTNLYPLDNETFGTIPGKLGKGVVKSVFVSKTYSGDTACTFNDFDPVNSYTNTVARGVESGDKYYINGQFHYRPRFNDTIFRLDMPNRLIPRYVIDFGDRGISSSVEGLNPKFSLKEKFVHNDIIETADQIFIQYTQDYSCPNTARKGTLKYNRCCYFKKTGELIHIMLDAAPVQESDNSWPSTPKRGLINDIDNGLEFWPDGITDEGIPFERFSGKQLRDKIKQKGVISKELIDLANDMRPNELLIILAK